MLTDPTHAFFLLKFVKRRRGGSRKPNQPALVMENIENGQVVLFDQTVQHLAVRRLELQHHHPGARRIVDSQEGIRDFWSLAQQRVEGTQGEVKHPRGWHQRYRFHGGLRHQVPMGGCKRQPLVLRQRRIVGRRSHDLRGLHRAFSEHGKRCGDQQEKYEQQRGSRKHGLRTGQRLLKVALDCAVQASWWFRDRCMPKWLRRFWQRRPSSHLRCPSTHGWHQRFRG